MKFGAGSLTSPTGVPHRSMQEQVFEGQRVPTGTVLIANIWFVVIVLTGCSTLLTLKTIQEYFAR